jgi:hypothetical protein
MRKLPKGTLIVELEYKFLLTKDLLEGDEPSFSDIVFMEGISPESVACLKNALPGVFSVAGVEA